MANSLKGSRTGQILINSFAGEAQARNRYTYFSKVAKKEGYEQISEIFLMTAENELEHAKLFYKLVGNNTKALNFYNKILTLDAKNTDAYFNKGLILASQKNYDECIQCFEKVIELSPDYPYAYYSLGLAYEQKEDIDKALEYYYLYSGIEKDEKMLNVVNQKIKQLEK